MSSSKNSGFSRATRESPFVAAGVTHNNFIELTSDLLYLISTFLIIKEKKHYSKLSTDGEKQIYLLASIRLVLTN
jgi:hypothetical protein